MKFIYKSVNIETIKEYMDRFDRTAQKSSDYSSGVLLCWADAFGYQFAFDDDEDLVWIRGNSPQEHFLAPVGNWDIKGWDEIIGARFGRKASFRAVPEQLVDIWRAQMPDAVEAVEDRDSWEYLHNFTDLAELPGKKYMKKRNRIHHFMNETNYEYIPITPDLIPKLIDFQNAWCESYRVFNGFESIEQESRGIIREIFGNWESLPQMTGGAIEILGKIAAYTVAETVGDTLMIHFEKASLEYNAAFQVINHEFLTHVEGDYRFVNREEDMGDPGLRDAKMSYHPCDFVKKYIVKVDLNS